MPRTRVALSDSHSNKVCEWARALGGLSDTQNNSIRKHPVLSLSTGANLLPWGSTAILQGMAGAQKFSGSAAVGRTTTPSCSARDIISDAGDLYYFIRHDT